MKALSAVFLLATVSVAQSGPPSSTWLSRLAQGQNLEHRGRFTEAEDLVTQLINEADSLDAKPPEFGEALAVLGTIYQDLAHYDKAEGVFRRAVEWQEKTNPNATASAVALSNLGNCLVLEEKYSAALPLFNRAAEILKQPAVNNATDLSIVLFSTAFLYRETNQDSQAEDLYRQSIQVAEKAEPFDRHMVANALSKFAAFLNTRGRFSEAESSYKRALQVLETGSKADSADLAALVNNLGEVYFKQERWDEAESLYRRSLKLSQEDPESKPWEPATAEFNLARLYAQTGKFSEANSYFLSAEQHFKAAVGPMHPAFASVIFVEGDYYRRRGYYQKAQPLLSEAAEIFGRAQPDSLNLAAAQISLAQADLARGNVTDADQLCRNGLNIRTRTLGSEHRETLQAEQTLGEILRIERQYLEAELLYVHAIKGFESRTTDRAYLQIALDQYAALLQSMGRKAEAKQIQMRLKTVSRTAFVAQ